MEEEIPSDAIEKKTGAFTILKGSDEVSVSFTNGKVVTNSNGGDIPDGVVISDDGDISDGVVISDDGDISDGVFISDDGDISDGVVNSEGGIVSDGGVKSDVVSSLYDEVLNTEEGVKSKVKDWTLFIQADQLNILTASDKDDGCQKSTSMMELQVNVCKRENPDGKVEGKTIYDINGNGPSEGNDCVLKNEKCLNGYMCPNGKAGKVQDLNEKQIWIGQYDTLPQSIQGKLPYFSTKESSKKFSS